MRMILRLQRGLVMQVTTYREFELSCFGVVHNSLEFKIEFRNWGERYGFCSGLSIDGSGCWSFKLMF